MTITTDRSAFTTYTDTPGVFDALEANEYRHVFKAELLVGCLAGGIPKNERIAEGWIKTKLRSTDDLLRSQVAETMLSTAGVERADDAVEAAVEAVVDQSLVGFKRDATTGELFIEGRQMKAAIKEATSVALAAGALRAKGWGKTNKGAISYLAEHVFVLEERLPLGVFEPTGIEQRFVHTFRGSSIKYTEFVEAATLAFTVVSDHDYSDDEWAKIWVRGQHQGIGADRSQGFGTYKVTNWQRVSAR